MIYEMKYLCSNWEIKTSPFHPNMEILGSFIACINELPAKLKKTTVQTKMRIDKLKIEKLNQDIRVIGFYSFGLISNYSEPIKIKIYLLWTKVKCNNA